MGRSLWFGPRRGPTSTFSLAKPDHKRRASLLLCIAIASILLWQTSLGSFLLYPFTILATWFHEMGHGLAAMLTGSDFERLLIFPDGSGVAVSLRDADRYRTTDAIIAAGGPMGPAVAGSLLIIASRTPSATRSALTVLGTALILSTLIWVRTLTGWLVLPTLGVAIVLLAQRGSTRIQHFAIQFLGVQACISVWRQFDYLFSSAARIEGQLRPSDTSAIAEVLFLPFWIWGAIISAIVIALLWWSFRVAFRR